MIYSLYLQEGTPLALFDAVEVSPVGEINGICERLDVSIDDYKAQYPDAEIFWSVYLHYDATRPENKGFGGVECVADLPNEEAAIKYAEGLEYALQQVRKQEVDYV
jgi:hypothetical protein